MSRSTTARIAAGVCSAAVAVAGFGAAPQASAQSVYRCRSGSSTYVSDRPCTTGAASTLGTLAPAPSYSNNQQPSTLYLPRPEKAAEHTAYLSPACADIAEAIRTGPTRGVRGEVLSGLHTEYRQKCADEDAAARQRVQEDRRRDRDARQSAQLASQQQQQLSRQAVEQCNELLRILAGKRQRVATMSEGERADLQRSEENYAQRCKR